MKEYLVSSFQKIGFDLSDIQVNQFCNYYELLIEKNKVMNLTGITEFCQVVQKHFIDSIMSWKIIQKFFENKDENRQVKLIDVGTGAGFPGVPLKILFPDLNVVLLDSLNKRVLFLKEVIENLKMEGIFAVHGRAEDLARNTEFREQFDLCVSRAVSNLSTLSEYCIPFLKVNGIFISYKSGGVDEELHNAAGALKLLCSEAVQVHRFDLPGSDISRSLVEICKKKPISKKYPRKAGLPGKEPLS